MIPVSSPPSVSPNIALDGSTPVKSGATDPFQFASEAISLFAPLPVHTESENIPPPRQIRVPPPVKQSSVAKFPGFALSLLVKFFTLCATPSIRNSATERVVPSGMLNFASDAIFRISRDFIGQTEPSSAIKLAPDSTVISEREASPLPEVSNELLHENFAPGATSSFETYGNAFVPFTTNVPLDTIIEPSIRKARPKPPPLLSHVAKVL